MFGTLKGRFLVIAAVIAASVTVLLINGIILGLDLSGGVYLALEVKDDGTMAPETRRSHTEQNEQILRNRIDEFGVTEPTVQRVGDYRILVELPGMRDLERESRVIERQAFLEWKLVLEDMPDLMKSLERMDRAVLAALGPAGVRELEAQPAPRDTASRLTEDVQRELFARDTARDTTRDTIAGDTTRADSAAADTLDAAPASRPLSSLIFESGAPGELQVGEEHTERVRRYLALPGVADLLPRGSELKFDARTRAVGAQLYRPLYFLQKEPFITGEQLENATAGRDPQYNQTIVSFTLNRRGGRIFDRVTAANINKRIAIVLDEQVHSAPVVRGRIGASGQIEMGQSPLEEARDLALVLRAGAFSAPLEIVERRTIGPTLGAASIQQGQVAAVFGVLLVLVIMVSIYRFSGLLAVVALAVYLLVLLAGLSLLRATLTAPGIAGIILSLGMAVDANVLIFERIREELALGRTVRAAVDNGFKHAMSAIVDSNITTLISSLILFQFGTGPVKGFAATLSIGIMASFFSAIYVTRTLMLLYLERRRAAEAISI
jgi:preprotein translocase subunit SecD